MKQAIKLLLSFLGGVVVATTVISIWLPPRLVSSRSVVCGSSPQWSLEAFEAINSEMTELVTDPNITMAVIPRLGGNDYNIMVSDDRLRARFGFVSWEQSLKRIHDRMDELRRNGAQAEVPNPR